jgi:hypothetical protein
VALRAAFGLADANLDDQLAALPAATGAVVEDAIFVTPRAQPAVRPDEDAPLGDDIKYLAAAKMNENVSTPTAWTLKDHAGTGTIATAPVTRVGTTVTKGRDT